MERPSLLLWDWDNTLVDGWVGITAAMNAAFAAFALPRWTVDDTRRRARVSVKEAFPALFGSEWRRAREIFYSTFSEDHLDHVTPMPGAADALAAGAAWPQGVVSNKRGDFPSRRGGASRLGSTVCRRRRGRGRPRRQAGPGLDLACLGADERAGGARRMVFGRHGERHGRRASGGGHRSAGRRRVA